MTSQLLHFAALTLFVLQSLTLYGQDMPDIGALSSMGKENRIAYIHKYPYSSLDSAGVRNLFNQFFQIADDRNDKRMKWTARFYYFQQRRLLKQPHQEITQLLTDLVETASDQSFEVEKTVAQHYLTFDQFDHKMITFEQVYAAIIREFDMMQRIGLEKFKPWELERLLKHSAKIMYDLEDYDKALAYVTAAEKYLEPTESNRNSYVLILNYIQSIYQQQKNYDKGIEYANKILNFIKSQKSDKPDDVIFYHQWEGLASIDIASMLVGQNKFAEGESYADRGYALIKNNDFSNSGKIMPELDALQVLIPTKLELGKIAEAETLLQRASTLLDLLQKSGSADYFKPIRLYQLYARFYEMKSDFARSVYYNNLAKPLQDSLNKRNDTRKLEKITQRVEAEKYDRQLRKAEARSASWGFWLVIVGIILFIVLIASYYIYREMKRKRFLALRALEVAEHNLASFTQGLREKSEQVEKLRNELENLSRNDARNEYFEKLTNSTILTDQDWVEFRALFEKVHPQFIASQKSLYPDLTHAETRLLVLEKLGLNTQEMANMLGVSKNTINQTRVRLRRKIGGQPSTDSLGG